MERKTHALGYSVLYRWCSVGFACMVLCSCMAPWVFVRASPLVISEDTSVTVLFSEPVLSDVYLDGRVFTELSMENCFSVAEPGDPALPVHALSLLIPFGKTVDDISVSHAVFIELEYDFIEKPVMPQQKSVALSEEQDSVDFVINEEVYACSNPVFSVLFDEGDTGFARGYEIMTVFLYPVQYYPKSGRVLYTPVMTVDIVFAVDGDSDEKPSHELFRNSESDKAFIASKVNNAHHLSSYPQGDVQSLGDGIEPLGDGGSSGSGYAPLSGGSGLCDPLESYEYVIITSESLLQPSGFAYSWSDLLLHRQQKDGLSGVIVTVEDIYACEGYWNSNSVFNDSAALVREFIKDAYLNWGTQYVLLGGGWQLNDASRQIVPARIFTDSKCTSSIDWMASDLYFSNLDGDWWYASQSVWGGGQSSGVNDKFSEVFVGRVPVWSVEQVSNFVHKVLWYDAVEDSEWLSSAAFLGADLGWTVTSKQYMEELRLGTGPGVFSSYTGFEEWNAANPDLVLDTSHRYYHADGYSSSDWLAAMNNNDFSIISHLGHGNRLNTLNNGYGVDLQSNTNFFLATSQACLSGQYAAGLSGATSYLSYWSDKGGYAMVLNTGYGYGYSSSTSGMSQHQHKIWWDYFFNVKSDELSAWRLGLAMAYTKDTFSAFIDSGSWANCYVWYSWNLFGDPAQLLRIDELDGNTAPVVSSENPSDGQVDVSVDTAVLSVVISDMQGDSFNWSIQTSPNIGSSFGVNEGNGTKVCSVSGLAYGTTYTWFVNVSDGVLSREEVFSFTTEQLLVNNPVVIGSPSPAHHAGDVCVFLPSVSVVMSDSEGDSFNWSIQTSPDVGSSFGVNEGNGTKVCSVSGLDYATTYTWFVNGSDSGNGSVVSEVFVFTTRAMFDVVAPSDFSAVAIGRFAVSLSWTKSDDITSIVYNGNEIYNGTGTSFTHINLEAGVSYTYEAFSYNLTDKLWSDSVIASTTTQSNLAPIFSSVSPGNDTEGLPLDFTWSIVVMDSEGDVFSYTLECSNGQISSGNNQGNGTKTIYLSNLFYNTVYYMWVNATDEYNDSNSQCFVFTTMDVPPVNSEPVVSNPSPGNGSTQVSVDISVLEITIIDPDGDSFNWSIQTNPDIGSSNAVFDSNGTKTCSVSHLQYSTTYVWFVNVSDGTEWVHQFFSFTTIDPPLVNTKPVIFNPNPINGSVDCMVDLVWSVDIVDADGDSFNWSIDVGGVAANSSVFAFNGTKSVTVSALLYSTQYTVFVSACDGVDEATAFFVFTTMADPGENQSVPLPPSSPSPVDGAVGIGISYAGFTDTISVSGNVNTATVILDVEDYSGTYVYKVWGDNKAVWPGNFAPFDKYCMDEEILILRGFINDLPTETEIIDWAALTDNFDAELVAYAVASEGAGDNLVDITYHNLFPCVDFTADFVFQYTGSIPAKLWADYEITDDNDDLLSMLLAAGEITVEAYEWIEVATGVWEIGDPVDIGHQVHNGDKIYVALTIHIPQDNTYQGLSGSFSAWIHALQWNEDGNTHNWP